MRVCREGVRRACVKVTAGARVTYVDASVPSRGLTFYSVVMDGECEVVVM